MTVDVVLTVHGGVEISRAVAASPALLGVETGSSRPPSDLAVDFCDWPFTDPAASVDGANVAAYAQYGRIWCPGRQLERPDLSYYGRVRESLGNLHAAWNMGRDDAGESVPVAELVDGQQTLDDALARSDGGNPS